MAREGVAAMHGHGLGRAHGGSAMANRGLGGAWPGEGMQWCNDDQGRGEAMASGGAGGGVAMAWEGRAGVASMSSVTWPGWVSTGDQEGHTVSVLAHRPWWPWRGIRSSAMIGERGECAVARKDELVIQRENKRRR